MKIPPLLIGGVLLFWGNEHQTLLIGFLLALLFEGGHLVTTRYQLQEEDFVKISDLTSLLFLGAIALILLNYEPIGFLRITTGWLPLILSPLMLAQIYSTGDTITIGTRLGTSKKSYTHKAIDFRFYYLMICIFAAATGNSRSVLFYLLLGLFVVWFLYWNRGRSFSTQLFAILIALSLTLGYGATVGLERTHRYVVKKTIHLMHRLYYQRGSDPYKSHVNFGDTGRLKLSGAIIMRVASPSKPALLMKEASFSTYDNGHWYGNQSGFTFLQHVTEKRWNLADIQPETGKKIRVEFNLPREKGLLPIAHGGYHVFSDTIFELEHNGAGTVKVADGAPIITYDLAYSDEPLQKDTPLGKRYLDVPEGERDTLDRVVKALQGPNGSAQEKIATLQHYFLQDFSYSLKMLGRGDYDTALANFLLQEKSGFCEYYATATTLLLRTLGIPSRYAVGYAVMEKSALEGKYIVRKRHAHAWAEAYVDGKWQVVDTTPADWPTRDAERASAVERLRDVFSFARHKYKQFQIGTGDEYTLLFSIVVIVLTTFLVYRIYRRLRIKQQDQAPDSDHIPAFTPVESPFTPVIDVLLRSNKGRRENESFVDWALRTTGWRDCDGADFDRADFARVEFAKLYRLHLQLRFDPKGLSDNDTELLHNGAEKYIEMLVGEDSSEG